MEIIIKSGKSSAKITTLGAELLSLTDSKGKERMWCGDPTYWAGTATVLFPTCGSLLDEQYTYRGKLYRMGGHGLAYGIDWQVAEQREDYVKMTLSENDDTLAIYPFKFKLSAEFSIREGGLGARFTVENCSEDALPYMFGWHPGFTLEGDKNTDSSVELPGKASVKIHKLKDGRYASPVGTPFALDNSKWVIDDKEMDFHKTLVLTEAGCRAILRTQGTDEAVDFTWSDNIPVFCMWKKPDERARYICLEPWTNMPNDGVTPENFDTRTMVRLPSGEAAVYTYDIKLLG